MNMRKGFGERQVSKESTPAHIESNAAPGKRNYTKPRLRIFGSVRELTMGGSGSRNDVTRTHTPGSDIRLKENIVRIGDHPLGFGLYLFDYRPEHRDAFGRGRRFGVLADEVARIVPDAVTRGADGYLRVDHARIGVHPAD